MSDRNGFSRQLGHSGKPKCVHEKVTLRIFISLIKPNVHLIKVIHPRYSLPLDIDKFFTLVILTTKYTKSMSDSLKSELKLLFAQKSDFSANFILIHL